MSHDRVPLFVVTDPDRRGAQVFAWDLAQHLRPNRCVNVVALGPAAGPSPLTIPVLGPHRRSVRSLMALRRAIRGASCVVGFGSTTLPAVAIASIGSGVPFIYRSIGELGYWASTPARRVRVRAALRRASAVVVLWDRAAPSVMALQVPPERIHVIPRGVSAATFTPRNEGARARARQAFGLPLDTPVVAVVGSLSREKRVDVAIQSIAAAGPDTQALIVGDGPERASLRAMGEAVAPGRVLFVGPLRDSQPAYAAADVLLLTSESEGMPGVLIEAGLSARPAVTTDVGAASDVVVDGATGVVVPIDASPTEIGTAIRRAISHRDQFGAAARTHCLEHYELELVTESWRRLLAAIGG